MSLSKEAKVSVVMCIMVPDPVLQSMTRHAIKCLRLNADRRFELIIVEARGRYFDPEAHDAQDVFRADPCLQPDQYLNFDPPIGGVKELNAGMRAATGDFVLNTGNDIFVPKHWDTQLLRCFEERKDCAIASMTALEPGAVIGSPQILDCIVEGHYSPFMMVRKGEEFDEVYRKIYQDSDFIMRVYERGQRAYRTCRAQLHHLTRQTSNNVDQAQHARDLSRDERTFYTRWGNNPTMIFNVVRHGHHQWGREHEKPAMPMHYDPSKTEG